MSFAICTAPLLALALCAPTSHPLIAEIFYDAIGDDTGLEYVELFNPSPAPFPLAGARLESGDGAQPDRWTLRWVGAAADTVAAGGRFVVGGARVVPSPHAVVTLDLQNGPDAVRMVWVDGAVETVGYGAHTLAEYSCGAPAPDAAAGLSLARSPDDADLGSNAQDFTAASPSPGAANRPGRDAALVAGSLALDPEQPAVDAPATLTGALVNRGREPIGEHELEVTAIEADAAEESPLASLRVAPALAAGDTAWFALSLPGRPAGKRRLRVHARLAGDAVSANDADSMVTRVGPGPLEVTEIQFHPTSGEGEWVEVRNRSGGPLELGDFSLADRRGSPGLPGGATLAAESLAVLAQDSTALLARFPALDARRVRQVKPWSSLNNSDDPDGVADVVTLREGDGTPCERVAYSAAGIPAGVPLERGGDGAWRAATDPLGSPLAPPRALAPLPGRFVLSPRRLGAPGARMATLGWELPWPRGWIAVDLYDLAGRRVMQVLPETAVTARGERTWSAGSLPSGLYVMALLARGEGAAGTLTATQPLRIEGSAP